MGRGVDWQGVVTLLEKAQYHYVADRLVGENLLKTFQKQITIFYHFLFDKNIGKN